MPQRALDAVSQRVDCTANVRRLAADQLALLHPGAMRKIINERPILRHDALQIFGRVARLGSFQCAGARDAEQSCTAA